MVLHFIQTCKYWISFQEVENFLTGTAHEDTSDTPSIEHDAASVSNHDVETQCESVILLDADTQCEQLLKRTIGIQPLAPRHKKTKKSKKISTPLKLNDSCEVGTPLIQKETEKHKPSTARALYHNDSDASPPSAQTVMKEADTTIPLVS